MAVSDLVQPEKPRSSLKIYLDILSTVLEEGDTKPTRILYRANLSHDRLTRYIEELKAKGLINENQIEDGRYYTITPKGLDFLHEIKRAESFLAGFGLSV